VGIVSAFTYRRTSEWRAKAESDDSIQSRRDTARVARPGREDWEAVTANCIVVVEETKRLLGSAYFTFTAVMPTGSEGKDTRILPLAEALSAADFDPPFHVILIVPSGVGRTLDFSAISSMAPFLVLPEATVRICFAVIAVAAMTVTGPDDERAGPQRVSPI
jgi:hypothetical protein